MSSDDAAPDDLASTRAAAARRGHTAVSPPARIPTGFAALDAALGGGVPRQRITEIGGVPTSGMATLALKIVAQAHARGGTAVYLDPNDTFDPDYAHRCGVRLPRLTLVRPADLAQLAALLADLAAGPDVLVCDLPLAPPTPTAAQALATGLGRLVAALNDADCAVLCLTTLPASAATPSAYPLLSATLAHYAAVRLRLRRQRWLHAAQDVSGYQAQVQVRKNKFGAAGQQVPIAITFDDVVHGDAA
ncbi:MAG: hypothetical protein KC425_24495 [Anaerolineales bacterium]|nr:hypothetical protein [Anaerolineales bacterium]